MLQYASPELQNNFEFIKFAVSHHGYALRYASSDLQNDFEIEHG